MIHMRRRRFLYAGAAAGIGTGLALWLQGRVHSATPEGSEALAVDRDGVLDLPRGFRYRILEHSGETMDDGFRVPALADGMACFRSKDGRWVLMRNHEVDLGMFGHGPFPPGSTVPPEAYDPQGAGGVTRVVIDPKTLSRVSSNLVLAGTARNCAGGPSPWGWLSCEESEQPGHGFVFLCPIDAAQLRPPRRVIAYGRFNHEAVAIDPKTLTAYLTEDQIDSCLYRMRPDSTAHPFEGALEAMALPPNVDPDTGRLGVGEELPVRWVKVPQPVPTDGPATRHQVRPLGAAIVRRGEGIWHDRESVYFTATIGGPHRNGQIFQLRLTESGERLRVLASSNDPRQLEMPDNVTVAPWGDLFVCEDGPGANYLRRMTPKGEIEPFARNAMSDTELAGVCFSPDGRALFVNIQHEGLTLMVTGPFRRYALCAPAPRSPGQSSVL